MSGAIRDEPGGPLPIGVHECLYGFNVAVFSRHATRMALSLFCSADATQAFARFDLDVAHAGKRLTR